MLVLSPCYLTAHHLLLCQGTCSIWLIQDQDILLCCYQSVILLSWSVFLFCTQLPHTYRYSEGHSYVLTHSCYYHICFLQFYFINFHNFKAIYEVEVSDFGTSVFSWFELVSWSLNLLSPQWYLCYTESNRTKVVTLVEISLESYLSACHLFITILHYKLYFPDAFQALHDVNYVGMEFKPFYYFNLPLV